MGRKEEVIIAIIFFIIFLFNHASLVLAKEMSTIASVEVKPAYALNIDINILNEKILSEENLSVFILLEKFNLTPISNEIPVDLNYEVIKGRKIVENGFLMVVDASDKIEEIINISISSDLRGKNILKLTASNPQSYPSNDQDEFVITKKPKGKVECNSFFFNTNFHSPCFHDVRNVRGRMSFKSVIFV